MKKVVLFLMVFNFTFALEKYKTQEILSIWEIRNSSPILIQHQQIEKLGTLNALKKQKELWVLLKTFYPPEISSRIKKFVVFSDNKDNYDGMFGLIEAVSYSNNSNFIFSVDINDCYSNNTLDTELFLSMLIHEFFHLISLNETQLSPTDNGGLKIHEGYLKSDSYLSAFYKKFWNNSFGKKIDSIIYDETLDKDTKNNLLSFIYKTNKDKFIEPYAMTNFVEDSAMCFEEFVRRNKKYLGNNLLDKKIAFFYDYPQLVEYKFFFMKKRRELLKKQM